LCDPGSMACTPTKTSYTTQTLSTYEANTQISRVTMTTQWVSTNEFESTHTAYRQIPAYAAFGMNDPQFLMLAGFVVLILVVGILVIFVRTQRIAKPAQAKPSQLKSVRVFCTNCGTRLPSGSRFCAKCGTEQT
jgi:ribosomal protein L40E